MSILQGLGLTHYFFDASGALMGISTMSDKATECPDGHNTVVKQQGEICAFVGMGEDACSGAGGAGGVSNQADAGSGGSGGAPNP